MHRKLWIAGGILFTLAAGTALHFIYDWSGRQTWVGFFAPVNESIWEHLKLLAIPAIIYAAVEYFCYGKNIPAFVPARMLAIRLGMLVIAAAFYLYYGAWGKHFLWADIACFILGSITCWLAAAKWQNSAFLARRGMQFYGWGLLVLLLFGFAWYSVHPPGIPLFHELNNK